MSTWRSSLSVLAGAGMVILLAACAPANGHNAAGESGGGKGGGGGDAVATVGEATITRAQLEEYLRKINPKAVQDYYDAQSQALNGLINTQLMETAAAAEGLTAEALQSRILATAGEVTEEKIKEFYDANQNRMGLKSLDDMREQIRTYLVNQGQQQVLVSFLQEQHQKQGVAILMDPPRAEVAIAANDPYKGPEGAAITIVEFSDFQ